MVLPWLSTARPARSWEAVEAVYRAPGALPRLQDRPVMTPTIIGLKDKPVC